jgi:hypothetical protein
MAKDKKGLNLQGMAMGVKDEQCLDELMAICSSINYDFVFL